MANTIYTSQEVIALLPDTLTQLKETLLYLVKQCEGEVILSNDGREDEDISEIDIYSEHFEKKHLDILFQYTFYYKYVSIKRGKLKVSIELELIKGA